MLRTYRWHAPLGDELATMDAATITTIGGVAVAIIGAISLAAVQIIGKMNEVKVAVDGRMSEIEKSNTKLLATFEQQMALSQQAAAAAREKKDAVTDAALADAREQTRTAVAVAAALTVPVVPAPPPTVIQNGVDVHPTAVVEVTKGGDVREGEVELKPKPPEKGKA